MACPKPQPGGLNRGRAEPPAGSSASRVIRTRPPCDRAMTAETEQLMAGETPRPARADRTAEQQRIEARRGRGASNRKFDTLTAALAVAEQAGAQLQAELARQAHDAEREQLSVLVAQVRDGGGGVAGARRGAGCSGADRDGHADRGPGRPATFRGRNALMLGRGSPSSARPTRAWPTSADNHPHRRAPHPSRRESRRGREVAPHHRRREILGEGRGSHPASHSRVGCIRR